MTCLNVLTSMQWQSLIIEVQKNLFGLLQTFFFETTLWMIKEIPVAILEENILGNFLRQWR